MIATHLSLPLTTPQPSNIPPKPKAKTSKKAKAVKESSPQFVAAPLSGKLTRLVSLHLPVDEVLPSERVASQPFETLMNILCHCGPKSVVNLLASCKALNQLASQVRPVTRSADGAHP